MRSLKLLKTLAASILLALLIYIVNISELLQALSNISAFLLVLLLLISVLLVLISAFKWKLFIDTLNLQSSVKAPSLIGLFNLYLLGYFVNLLLPSYIGGDVVRSAYAGKSVGKRQAFTSTILERYTGLLAMIILALLALAINDLATPQIKFAIVLCAAVLLVISLASLSGRVIAFSKLLPKGERIFLHLQEFQNSIKLVRKRPKLLLQAMLLSFLFHSITVLNTALAAHAVGWNQVSISDLFVVLPLILLVGSLPIAPSGLGIQEGAFLYFLHGVGASPAQALGVGLVLRAKSYLLAIWGGVIFWLKRS